MTKEQTKQAIAVMQAYVDGKALQYKSKNTNHWHEFLTASTPTWRWLEFDYRIKPEAKVRPYTYEEMCKEIKKHGGYIKLTESGAVYNINFFDKEIIISGNDREADDYEFLCRNFVWFDDNTPCGVVEEE